MTALNNEAALDSQHLSGQWLVASDKAGATSLGNKKVISTRQETDAGQYPHCRHPQELPSSRASSILFIVTFPAETQEDVWLVAS